MKENEINNMSLHELLEYTGSMTDMIEKGSKSVPVCFNHMLERYLYEYWNNCTEDEYNVNTEPYNAAYIAMGNIYHASGDQKDAVKSYEHAAYVSPADLDARFSLAMELRSLGKWEDMKKCVSEAYDYIFTKADIAQYYRYMGVYQLENYHPDKALALYRYSILFSRSQTADAEIGFLKDAGTDMTEMDTEKLRKIVSGENIPLQPDPATIGITFKVGKNELEHGDISYGKLLLRSVWELTGDEEAGVLSADR